MALDTKTLKPGDEVAVRTGYGYPTYEVDVVDRVTPSGRVHTVNGMTFNPDGSYRGADGYSRTQMVELTDDVRLKIEKWRLVIRLRDIDRKLEDMPIEALRQIAEIVEAATANPEGGPSC